MALLVVSLGALLLRLSRIEAREPWLDEACSALLSGGDLTDLARIFGGESNPPLYYATLLVWQKIAGNAPWALRLPSVAAGVVLVPLVWLFARRLGAGRLASLAGALMAAASPLLLFYSLEARAYLPLWSLSLAAVLALDVVLTHPDRTRWVVTAAILTAAAMYTHYYGVFLLPLWGIAWWAAPRGSRRRLGVAALATCLAWAPWAVAHLTGHVGHRGQAWLEQFTASPGAMLLESMSILCLVPPFPSYLGELGTLQGIPILAGVTGLLLGALVLWGVIGAWNARGRANPWRGSNRARVTLVAAAVLNPILGGLAVSLVRPIYLPGRYELMAHPPMLVVWALGLGGIMRLLRGQLGHWTSVLAVTLTFATVAPLATSWWSAPRRAPDHRALAERLHEAPEDEGLVSIGLLWAPLEYPLRRLPDRRPHASHPREVAAAHPGWVDLSEHDEPGLRSEALETLDELDQTAAIWVAVGLGPDGAIAQQRLTGTLWGTLRSAGWTPGPPEVFGGIGLVRFGRPDTEARPR